jgi:hypothetical protein
MIGIGIQQAGLTGAGLGQATAAVVPPAPGQGAPFLTTAGDYVIDSTTGDIGRTTSVRHRVQLALGTDLASATADTSLGDQKPKKINQSSATDAQAGIQRALQTMVDDGSIRVDEIQVDVLRHSPGTVSRVIQYTDLSNQANDKAVK